MKIKVFVALIAGVAVGFAGGWIGGTRSASSSGTGQVVIAQDSSAKGALKDKRLKRLDRDGVRGPRDRKAERFKGKRGMADGKQPRQARPVEDPKAIYKFPVENSPVMGPANAKITIIEVSDYECPFCVRGDERVKELLAAYPNDVRVVMKQNPLSFHAAARPAAMAALAAGEQGKYWQMHDKLFASTKARIKLTRERLDELAREIGLDMEKFAQALDSQKFEAQISHEQKMAVSLGARGTPAFFINGRKLSGAQPIEKFKALVEEELVRANAVLAKGVAAENLYEELVKDGSEKPVFLLAELAQPPSDPFAGTGPVKVVPIPATSPSKGPADAKVTLVEFLDFECPHCSTGAKNAMELLKLYPNDLRVVFRHQPLSFHKNAKSAAMASMAAHNQGKFWEMEAKLFENFRALSEEKIKALAAEVGLDMERFKKEWKSPEIEALVNADMEEGRKLGATGTPTFFLNGQMLVGARPLEFMRTKIDEILAKANQPAAPEAKAEDAAKAAKADGKAAEPVPAKAVEKADDKAPAPVPAK